MGRKRFFCSCICWMWVLFVAGQTYNWQDFLQEISFSFDEEYMDSPEWQELLEEMQELHASPMNINSSSAEQLKRLPFLSDQQIEDIHAYINLHGEMKSLGELLLIPSLGEEERRWLRLFVVAETVPQKAKIFSRPSHEVLTRLDIPLYYRRGQLVQTKGYRSNGLAGQMRYTLSNRHLQIGLQTRKDAGEPFFDSHGGYVSLKDVGIVQSIVLGDFRAAFGEGLVLGNGGWSIKSSISFRPLQGLRPMTGTTESGFLRGAAATLRLGKEWKVSAFVSHRSMDATLTDDGEVKTFVTNGYHRTETEYAKKHNTQATLVGGNIDWTHKSSYIGATGYFQTFSRTLNPGQELYRIIYPRGKNFGVMGVHYGTRWRDFTLGGETSFSTNQRGIATIHRLLYTINARHTLSVVQRYYNEHYYSFYGAALRDASEVQNENGILLNWQCQPRSGWQLDAYADFFFHRWPSFGMQHSHSGQELMGRASYSPNNHHTLTLSYRWKNKERYDKPDPHHKAQLLWSFTPSKTWQIRLQGAAHHSVEGCGLGVQALVLQTLHKPSLRWFALGEYVNTPTYLSRIYFYEPSLYKGASFSSLYGHCLHASLGLRWSFLNGKLMMEGRYGLLRFFDREEQGSGLQTIYSPWKNDLQVQVRVRL